MKRHTLQECIDYFNNNEIMKHDAVRQMEQLSEWKTASKYWRQLNRESDAIACEMIAEATEKGNSYRADVHDLNVWVDETVEQGIMSKEEAVKIIYPELNRIYNQHFPRL